MAYFVLHKEGTSGLSDNHLFRNADRQLCVWISEDNALAHAAKRKSSWETWRVRPANSQDYAAIGKDRKGHRKWLRTYVVMDEPRELKPMARRTTSVGCLVDVFEDLAQRKFAISSKASSEPEFITEVSEAIARSGSADWEVRLRELLPLIVDLCCKYRGYKAETVQERRELVAGDLDMPKAQ